MSLELQSILIYTLGVIGLLAIGIIPLRLILLLRQGRSQAGGKTPLRLVIWSVGVLACVAALVLDVLVIVRIARCLTSVVCGPGVATGWFNVSLLGATYILLELVLWGVRAGIEKRAV